VNTSRKSPADRTQTPRWPPRIGNCAEQALLAQPTGLRCDGKGLPVQRGRADDTIRAITRRLTVYQQRPGPLLRFYGDLVITVDGDQPTENVHQAIIQQISNRITTRLTRRAAAAGRPHRRV
jgi:adenylate kinase family enzyme